MWAREEYHIFGTSKKYSKKGAFLLVRFLSSHYIPKTEAQGALEAATGLEPVNNGFANRCLNHLATPPGFLRFLRPGLPGRGRSVPFGHFALMAERGGFEPPRQHSHPTGLAIPPLQPLGYLSMLRKLFFKDCCAHPRLTVDSRRITS
jgi:hypothetical protein